MLLNTLLSYYYNLKGSVSAAVTALRNVYSGTTAVEAMPSYITVEVDNAEPSPEDVITATATVYSSSDVAADGFVGDITFSLTGPATFDLYGIDIVDEITVTAVAGVAEIDILVDAEAVYGETVEVTAYPATMMGIADSVEAPIAYA